MARNDGDGEELVYEIICQCQAAIICYFCVFFERLSGSVGWLRAGLQPFGAGPREGCYRRRGGAATRSRHDEVLNRRREAPPFALLCPCGGRGGVGGGSFAMR